jgi:hypothetical protein
LKCGADPCSGTLKRQLIDKPYFSVNYISA